MKNVFPLEELLNAAEIMNKVSFRIIKMKLRNVKAWMELKRARSAHALVKIHRPSRL